MSSVGFGRLFDAFFQLLLGLLGFLGTPNSVYHFHRKGFRIELLLYDSISYSNFNFTYRTDILKNHKLMTIYNFSNPTRNFLKNFGLNFNLPIFALLGLKS